MSYHLFYNEKGYYDGRNYCGWGDFQCSVCGKDVFIQYDAHEKPSNGELTEYKDKCYCLCNKCVQKCRDKGKKKLLKDATPYEPRKEKEHEEPDYMKGLPNDYKSLAGLLPAVAMLAYIGTILNLPKEQRKKILNDLKKKKDEVE